jgi:GNAT superfamily N-acetyltransferase
MREEYLQHLYESFSKLDGVMILDAFLPKQAKHTWEIHLLRGDSHARVTLQLQGPGRDRAYIDGIRTRARSRGQGFAREILEDILQVCDNYGITTELIANPDRSAVAKDPANTLDLAQLVAWYKRFGFIPTRQTRGQVAMRRESRHCAPDKLLNSSAKLSR